MHWSPEAWEVIPAQNEKRQPRLLRSGAFRSRRQRQSFMDSAVAIRRRPTVSPTAIPPFRRFQNPAGSRLHIQKLGYSGTDLFSVAFHRLTAPQETVGARLGGPKLHQLEEQSTHLKATDRSQKATGRAVYERGSRPLRLAF
ncbi:hypothetical protein SKAU_G00333460 [Synaphobranchus kaupii]|uniref:Uncharacterized protein n=1 Tax=Synaphobranchus kaupii TaxID=118154 RepID=A0A9Q1IHT3_SYNKA|nr:hypothetical protein SKAU_G00333460 [Synaphobranchus kaupii]